MTKMFKSYDDISKDHVPYNRPKKKKSDRVVNNTTSLSALWPLYNAKEEIIGAAWNFGDAFDLPFEVKGNIIDDDGNLLDLEEFFTGKSIKIDILDHFYQEYTSFTTTCEVFKRNWDSIIIVFEFDEELSNTIERGTYHVRLTLDNYIIYSPLDSVILCR